MLISDYFGFFPSSEIRDIILLTINFCIKKLNEGQEFFIKETFFWYQKGLAAKVFIHNNKLSRYTYNNIMLIALKLSEFEWAKQFMEDYKKYIDSAYRHDIYYFNLALWYQYQKRYGEVQTLLSKITFKDVLQALFAKRILLKIYYEKGELKSLESLLDSIRIYLYRHKKLGYHKDNYLKLIRFTRKLIQLNVYDKVQIEKLKKEVLTEKSLLEKKWFLEKIEELL